MKSVHLDKEQHRELKKFAFLKETTVQEELREAVKRYIRTEGRKHGDIGSAA